MSDFLFEGLNEAQAQAVATLDGPLLVLAGPGSGKTRVITHRIANLLHHGVPPRQILALTFTNKAAEEMKQRVERLAPGQAVWTSTFHRFCARLLRQYAQSVGLSEGYTIYDTSDARQILNRTLAEIELSSNLFTPDRIATAISWAKNNLVPPDAYEARPGQALGKIVSEVYPAYQRRLLAANAVDFDDLLMHVAVMLRESPELRATLDARYRYIMVDEYQDTNLAQYAIVRALSIDYPNLCVTGDPDQSIYGWRGANLNNILDFETDYPAVKVVKLERNYRSTPPILRVANQLISNNQKRKAKGLFTENEGGSPVRMIRHTDNIAEAESIATRIAAAIHRGERRPRDFSIFYRMNALSREIEKSLRLLGIPYQMVNGLEFFQRKEIKDALAYLRLLYNPRDEVALLRVINLPPRGIGKSSIERLSQFAASRGLSLLEAARQAGMIESLNKRAAVAIAKFVHLIDRLSAIPSSSVEEILGRVMIESGYRDYLKTEEVPEEDERLANIEELLTAARQYDDHNPGVGSLEGFLEESSLVADTDAFEAEDDRVTLMTLHAAKGLEFPMVYIIALEEGILPHERTGHSPDQLEEERRLLFVGITRAKEELELSLAAYRDYRGTRRLTVPSKFLLEMPREEMQLVALSQPSHIELPDEYAQDIESDVAVDPIWEDDPAELAPQPVAAAAVIPLVTAAELAQAPRAKNNPLSPEVFELGMIVRHPTYGLGKIVALSGSGPRRSATITFASTAGTRKFVLAKSDLQPAREAK